MKSPAPSLVVDLDGKKRGLGWRRTTADSTVVNSTVVNSTSRCSTMSASGRKSKRRANKKMMKSNIWIMVA